MRPNDFTFKRDLDSITKLNCQARYDKLTNLINTIKSQPEANAELNKWEMNFSEDVVKFETKVMAQNTILFANTKDTAKSAGWNNSLRNARHISSIPLRKWLIVFMPRDQDTARTVNNEIMEISRPMGFEVSEARMVRLPEARGSPAGVFSQTVKSELASGQVQMVVCITPSNAKDTYDAIKKICCIDFGIPSQVLTTNTLKKNLKSVLTKVAIQMSCKLGGEIWGVNIPLKSVMVVGIDVYTDTSEKTKRTVTAFISSMNANVALPEIQAVTGCTRWFSRCMMESKEQKYSDWLHIMMQGKRID
jgi:aubergine-like protein